MGISQQIAATMGSHSYEFKLYFTATWEQYIKWKSQPNQKPTSKSTI